ncbi:hypothetical protein [Nesterenkonia marinintestina]|uniref:hypothetical protein n=1 Tax=Nesterenkonia marinintestina TaxID=2979865 RepID=UPI0021BFD031|nr:hypothetical protein [Nesterenkonia sp. GX14115]
MPTSEHPPESAAAVPQSAGPLVRALSAVLAETPEPAGDRSPDDAEAGAEDLLREALRRRHVETEEVMPGHLLFRFAGFVIGGMQGSLTTLVSQQSRRIAGDPKLLPRFLRHADVAVPDPEDPPQKAQDRDSEDDDEEDTEDGSDDGDAESSVAGGSALELEILVVGDDVVAGLLRTPPFEHSDQGLIFTADGEERLTVDVTDQLTTAVRELAADAVGALPGLGAASVHVLTPDLGSADDAVVTGLDVTPDIRTFHRPDIGRGRDAAGALAEKLLRRASR